MPDQQLGDAAFVANHHGEEAERLEAKAEKVVDLMADPRIDPGKVDPAELAATAAVAQVYATIALGHRTAEASALATLDSRVLEAELHALTQAVGDGLGDDSHLDGLKVTLRDISNGFAAGQP